MSETTASPTGEHLIVRALIADDLGFIRSLARDERVVRFVGDGKPWTDTYFQRRFTDALAGGGTPDRETRWFIAETAGGAEVGLLALTLLAAKTEVGYWVAPDEWGKGYATRLVEHGVVLAGTERPTVPIVATIFRDNVASRRVVERMGFTADPVVTAESATESTAEMTYRRPPLQVRSE
jgi:RimJ/RimL family protein N-acetyltransferase